MHSIRECFDRAEGAWTGPVVHGAATLAVLLAVKVKVSYICRPEVSQGSVVRKDVALFEIPNVFASELDGSGA
jgi:hypothetical protein